MKKFTLVIAAILRASKVRLGVGFCLTLFMFSSVPIFSALGQTSLQLEAAGTILGAYIRAYALHYVCVSQIQNTEATQRHRAAWRQYQNRWHSYANQTLRTVGDWRGQRWANEWYDKKIVDSIAEEQHESRVDQNYCFRMSSVMCDYLDMRTCYSNELRLLYPSHRF